MEPDLPPLASIKVKSSSPRFPPSTATPPSDTPTANAQRRIGIAVDLSDESAFAVKFPDEEKDGGGVETVADVREEDEMEYHDAADGRKAYLRFFAYSLSFLSTSMFLIRYLAGTGLVAGAAGFPQLQVWNCRRHSSYEIKLSGL
ncbi:hypothetical protein C3L33_09939, partial [Rhododendron williamsianum]